MKASIFVGKKTSTLRLNDRITIPVTIRHNDCCIVITAVVSAQNAYRPLPIFVYNIFSH